MLKSVRQIVLGSRVTPQQSSTDVSDLLASSIGTAIHDSIETAWVKNHKRALLSLGYPEHVVNQVKVNPSEPDENELNVFFEKRTEKQVGQWIVSGKFDLVFNGEVHDFKSTKVWTYQTGASDEKHKEQLSYYRWLNPDLITMDKGVIHFILTDWSKVQSFGKGYPIHPVPSRDHILLEPSEVESRVRQKLSDISLNWQKSEPELPKCSKEELWQGEPEYKYYANPSSKRATKVFNNPQEAKNYQLSKGKGYIKTVEAEPKACSYCSARLICSQYDGFVVSGLIK